MDVTALHGHGGICRIGRVLREGEEAGASAANAATGQLWRTLPRGMLRWTRLQGRGALPWTKPWDDRGGRRLRGRGSARRPWGTSLRTDDGALLVSVDTADMGKWFFGDPLF